MNNLSTKSQNSHSTFRVSCKAALFNPDGDKVLLVRYAPGVYGLPGGHIENDEHPDEAMARELEEELGLHDVVLRRGSFTKHEDGKIVLFYSGALPENIATCADPNELEAGEWVSIERIRNHEVELGSYAEFTPEAAERPLLPTQ